MARPTSPAGAHRPSARRYRPVWAACLALGLMGAGCSALTAHHLAARAARGDDGWIAGRTIDCRDASDGCADQHLIRGNACYRLAESGSDPAGHYACAANELETGLSLKPSASDAAERLELQERLCECLMKLHLLQAGAAARQTAVRLAEASRALFRLAPESVPAVYYLCTTRLLQIKPRLPGITAAERLPVCAQLKRTVTRVLSVMETASGQPPPAWDRFAGRYQRLAFELGAAMRQADCR